MDKMVWFKNCTTHHEVCFAHKGSTIQYLKTTQVLSNSLLIGHSGQVTICHYIALCIGKASDIDNLDNIGN